MKTRVKHFAPDGAYCLEGYASANSLFFEDSEDQRLFLNLLNRFLDGMIEVYGYSTNSTGWSLFFKVKDAKTIKEVYYKLKSKSKKIKVESRILEPKDMLAEHFRYFLSAYVKQSNFRHKRHGSRVHSKMSKYIYETFEDLEADLECMRQMKESKVQKEKYRPDMGYYLVEKELKRQSVWRHSFVGLGGEKLVQAVLPCYRSMLDKAEVLRQLILITWNLHFGPTNNSNPHPMLE